VPSDNRPLGRFFFRIGIIRSVSDILAGVRYRVAVRAGAGAAALSRRLGLGEGGIIGGRVTLTLDPHALRRLAAGRSLVLVSGTNGKTTTSHLLAALLGTAGPVAHNATGANMPDGAVAALTAAPCARRAVLEVDELHVAAVAEAVDPQVIVLLNLSRDQLDRGSEVRGVAAALSGALIRGRRTLVVANADDPMVVWAASGAAGTVWVGAGSSWSADTLGCPRCGEALDVAGERWRCRCGLARPQPQWQVDHRAGTVVPRDGTPIPVPLQLPGWFNLGNAALALAAAAALGIDPAAAAGGVASLDSVGGRYGTVLHGGQELRLLLAKNPAGWAATLALLEPAAARLLVVNAREPDGRDTSWLWDVPFEQLACAGTGVVAAGEKAADLGLRLSYAGVDHATVTNPLDALTRLPPGKVDVVANYSAFRALARQVGGEAAP
jgi:UDP-N-acetylmuramyl tripeptide synthase